MENEYNVEENESILERAFYYGEDRLENKKIAEKMINIAQVQGDLDLECRAKLLYLQSVTFLDESENILATYPWLLSQMDQHPNRFDEHSILWSYKWVIVALPKFPHISLAQINSALDDMEKRFMNYDTNNAPVNLYFRANIADLIGDQDGLKYYLDKFKPMMNQSTSLGNCKACVTDYTVQLFLASGQYQDAIDCAAPLIAKQLICAEVPERTYPRLAMAYWHLGNEVMARKMYQKYKPFIKPKEKQLDEIAAVINYLSLANRRTEALEYFEQKYPHSMNRLAIMNNFAFYLSGLLLFGKLKAENTATVKIKMPENFALYSPTNEYSVNDLYDFLMKECSDIAEKFDARNGNNHFAQQIAKQIIVGDRK